MAATLNPETLSPTCLTPCARVQDALAKAARSRQLSSGARAKARASAEGVGPKTLTLASIAARAGASGPLALLARCFAERGRVRVVTRHARGVRGTATGALRCRCNDKTPTHM